MPSGSEVGNQQAELSVPLQRASVALPCEAIPYLLSTGEALIILIADLFGCFVYHWLTDTPIPDLSAYFALGLFASFIHIARLSGRGFYDFENAAKPTVEVVEITISWLTTALVLAFFAFLFKVGDAFSRGSFLIFLVVAPVALLGERKLVKFLLMRAATLGAVGRRNVVLLGARSELDSLGERDLLAFFGACEISRFVLSVESDPVVRKSSDRKTLDIVAAFVRNHGAREVLLALSWNEPDRIKLVRDHLKALPVSARLLPDNQIRTLTNYVSSGHQRVVSLEIQRAPLSGVEQSVKRAMDLTLGTFALIFFMPAMALTALAIKLDGPGPVFFLQDRKGFSGRQFVMFKFRTMTVQENGSTVTQATRNDPRVTRIGRLLRAASIDELPQLINVIRGEMSLVGPRPHALAHDNHFENLLQDYAFRHHVKPGMTGWAQVNGRRGATPSVEQIAQRVEMDLWYINNWSLWFDIQILMKTFFEVVRKRNAF
jgi:undecaprenyl-phosphate galactose phosphotransferase/putative colanic acid biosynthesis UDP-glucose lipid carrier transferase